MEIYEKIKQIREDKDIKQSDIAKYLKISQPAYSMYEKGIREITANTLKDICIYLNYSADKILEIEQDNRKETINKANEIIKLAEEIKKI